MSANLLAVTETDVTAVVGVACLFGGGALYWIVSEIARNWSKTRIAEQEAVLKRVMIEKGFSAEEIERVIDAGHPPEISGFSADELVEIIKASKDADNKIGKAINKAIEPLIR